MCRLQGFFCGLIALLTVMPISDALSQSLSIDASKPAIHINLGGESPEYMCLSSAEYGQLYLPMKYQCSSCTLSEESKEVIEDGWSPDTILLAVRKGDEFDVRKINLSFAREFPLYTWYSDVAFRPHRYPDMRQCAESGEVVASCSAFKGHCLFLFEKAKDRTGPGMSGE